MSINRKNADGTYTEVAGVPYVTKENIGLGNVENKSSEQIREEITKENVVDALGMDPSNNVAFSSILYTEFLGRTIRSDDYKSAQGFLALEENGKTILYTCFYNYAIGEDKTIIQKIDNTGHIIAESNPVNLDHSNDMCYDGTYIYVCGYNANKAWVINPETLAVVRTINTPVYIQSMTYDKSKNLFYVYTTKGVERVYVLSADMQTIIHQFDYHAKRNVQTFEYYNGMLLMIENAPNSVTVWDVESWKELVNIKFNYFMSDYYPIGEVQTISIYNDNGDFVLCGKPRGYNYKDNEVEKVGSGLTAYGLGNFRNDVSYLERYTSPSLYAFNSNCNIDNTKYVFKPYGTVDSPFYNAGDASICLESEKYNPAAIYIRSNLNDVLSINNMTVFIDGLNHTVNELSLKNCSGFVGNLSAESGQVFACNLTLTNVDGGISYNRSTISVNDAAYKKYNTTQSAINRIAQSASYSLIGAKSTGTADIQIEDIPKELLVTRFNSETLEFSDTTRMFYSVIRGAKISGADFTVAISTQNVLTITNNNSNTKQAIRVYGIY